MIGASHSPKDSCPLHQDDGGLSGNGNQQLPYGLLD